MKTKKNTKVMR